MQICFIKLENSVVLYFWLENLGWASIDTTVQDVNINHINKLKATNVKFNPAVFPWISKMFYSKNSNKMFFENMRLIF